MITDNGIEYDYLNEILEPVPCGMCKTTRYMKGEEIVRQDIEIQITKGLSLDSQAGSF